MLTLNAHLGGTGLSFLDIKVQFLQSVPLSVRTKTKVAIYFGLNAILAEVTLKLLRSEM